MCSTKTLYSSKDENAVGKVFRPGEKKWGSGIRSQKRASTAGERSRIVRITDLPLSQILRARGRRG